MKIQDLSKDLSNEESAAVSGGVTQTGINVGGAQTVGGGFMFGSPVTLVSGPQINANTNTETDVNVATIANSALAAIGQLP